ncbi:hypothetical protein L6452_18875 [Arctium lappa]|uniref:Uncharacterized protein n=1 Tax=Arctium lappa TaxID=4217 RepID=A0ACB9C7I6_ARCLA|nr:hypothetical protein L6452_18875 [Arctium lappa]
MGVVRYTYTSVLILQLYLIPFQSNKYCHYICSFALLGLYSTENGNQSPSLLFPPPSPSSCNGIRIDSASRTLGQATLFGRGVVI